MFCPFINGNCVSSCVFNDGEDSCKFVRIIRNIESNTSTDQTESWSINNKLGDINGKLDRIIEHLEQSAD